MAHHKKPTQVDTYGTEVRFRRDRQASSPKMTRDTWLHSPNLPNPHPDGAPPTPGWVTYDYPVERRRRKRRALLKKIERRIALRRQEREALKEQAED